MNKGYLSGYFDGVGIKTLKPVDAEAQRSNQHEVGTNPEMRLFLGTAKTKFDVTYIWLGDEQESITVFGTASYYDSRKKKANRTPEYRLYYRANAVTDVMSAGDTLFLAIRPDRSLLFIVVPAGSTIQGQLLWLFGLDHQPGEKFTVRDFTNGDDAAIDFVSRFILDEIGIEFEDPQANTLDSIIERFGFEFPKTSEFSDLARLTLTEIDARDDPDIALLEWLDREEAMFRRLERRIVAKRIEEGFTGTEGTDVDAFIQYSLGVHNRRKSRMGHSFENQLKAVFDALEIRYDAQVITENGKKPDFVFPGKDAYFDAGFDLYQLTMLAAKSTCKDRWPQILPEAERIPVKHLVTLEPGISEAQTNSMQSAQVQLVVPGYIRDSYSAAQKKWIWSVKTFCDLVHSRQVAQSL